MKAKTEAGAALLVDSFSEPIAKALIVGALPNEIEQFDKAARADAARFVAETALVRRSDTPAISLETMGGSDDGGLRRMRLAVINADQPFLVDSVAAVIAAQGLAIDRLLHPVIGVERDADGTLVSIGKRGDEGKTPESMIYMEIERADAKDRRALVDAVRGVLADVRAAVRDWPKMQAALRVDAENLGDTEGAALLRWFLDGNLTQLAHEVRLRDGTIESALGIAAGDDAPLLADGSRDLAFAWFETAGNEAPLVLKSNRVATVHRRVPMDLLIVPVRRDGKIMALSIHAALWTSAALAAAPAKVPVLRAGLLQVQEKYGFSASGHAGKALAHALSELPHDLLIGFKPEALEKTALTAMSLADRPRPEMLLYSSPLGRHLFALVWLPREEFSAGRRTAIGEMLADAANASILSWALELDDSDVAQLRYTLDLREGGVVPDAAALNTRLVEMVRGWVPGVESALVALGEGQRAPRLAIRYANVFPAAYRTSYGPDEAARDILRLRDLSTEAQRGTRLFRAPGDSADQLRLKIYHLGGLLPLSDVVPALEHFGFQVLGESSTRLEGGENGYVHDFLLRVGGDIVADDLLARAAVLESAIAAVLEGDAENDAFNQLIGAVGFDPFAVVLLRAWFRYLRQTGMSYGIDTVAGALRRAPNAARQILDLFAALHDPDRASEAAVDAANKALDAALAKVAAIDDDRILRRIRSVVAATLRSNAYAPAAAEALAFKLDSNAIPGLPAPRPWREIWVYSPRVEGIHLRGGPIARGGLRWSDRRDDFRTEILGLMKAQLVKNAVIVPNGAKGGFYAKQLPSPAIDRDAWLAEGTESYRIFIRSLLSVTDNIVDDKVVHPERVVVRDGDDPYFVVAADKGTASFSDVANAIALDRNFWLGDAFASGGSQGYDHKGMGITARGAWVSVQRHFAEMGIDVQKESVTVAGCGDMSGDVFGNGMLLSKALKIVAAFDHRHIFLDPDPDPAESWKERKRLFKLPRSSWADYDEKLISKGGGVFPRTQKEIALSAKAAAAIGIEPGSYDPSTLISAILKAPVDLLWFGGIGTYIKSDDENNAEVGDPANDAHRVNGADVRARVVGEGANLGCTQAGRIDYARTGGRINTDFIDNSAGVDCSDNEVNIKIPLNREMREGRLAFDDRNALLVEMTDDVAALVLEDNRLQTLALSLAQQGGAAALPAQARVIEVLEAAGRIDRAVEGLESSDDLLRRAQDGQGLTRPELAILLSHGKLALQDAIEGSGVTADPALAPLLHAYFPEAMRTRFAAAIDAHRLRPQIIATKMANRLVNRLGLVAPFELAEEEGASMAQVAAAYFAADMIFGLEDVMEAIEGASVGEEDRLALFDMAAASARLHVSDLLRVMAQDAHAGTTAARLSEGVQRLDAARGELLKAEARTQASSLRARLVAHGANGKLADRIVRLDELDGAIGIAELCADQGYDVIESTQAYVRLGEEIGLDWAKAAVQRCTPADQWEKLLVAGLATEFEQLRLDFLARTKGRDPEAMVDQWLTANAARVAQFRALVDRARTAAAPTVAMLAQIGGQARTLLAR
ncbi:NAD-glutamate dehydrogenase [Sphingomonas sp. C3-2]|uniref:NAD-glutamate dehydrogenase n=1 Tax=Sphingomonas sp. C3-2 TaxID=3062169 RepID=UPI00294B337B|nr:NAD-glutamate dehydrogenase domain-containing protein [Sphingomonas sp. C3-2]WOK35403.1 NAD-glutamate dehydrogenase [Sphingomonas sp. C3-2]